MDRKSTKKIETCVYKSKIRILHKYAAITIIMFLCSLVTYNLMDKAITHINHSIIWCNNQLSNILLNCGFATDIVSLNGNYFVNEADVLKLIDKSKPILFISLSSLKQDIKSLSRWVKDVEIQRILPNTININLEEYKPFAVWQHDNQLSIIDSTGYVITDDYPIDKLIFISGNNALLGLEFVKMILESNNELNQYISSFIHVGNKRWNIIFNNGLEVKLPEDSPYDAWNDLIDLHNTSDIITSHWKVVDMRTQNKTIIKK